MSIEDLKQEIAQNIPLRNDRIAEERKVLMNSLSILNENIPWYKPWRLFSHIRRLKRATILIGSITISCINDLMSVQDNHLEILKIQKLMQKQLELMNNE